MAALRVTSDEPDDSKTRILKRTIEAVQEGGEVAVRVNEIAQDCGLSVTSLYHHFGSREGLIEAVQAARYAIYASQLLDGFERAVAKCRTAQEFRALAEATLDTLFVDEVAAGLRSNRLEILGSAVHRPGLAVEIGRRQAEFNAALAAALREPQDNGWIKQDLDLEVFSAFFLGVMNARYVIEVGDQSVDGETWNALAKQALLSAIMG